jgi:hypothetical protein
MHMFFSDSAAADGEVRRRWVVHRLPDGELFHWRFVECSEDLATGFAAIFEDFLDVFFGESVRFFESFEQIVPVVIGGYGNTSRWTLIFPNYHQADPLPASLIRFVFRNHKAGTDFLPKPNSVNEVSLFIA